MKKASDFLRRRKTSLLMAGAVLLVSACADGYDAPNGFDMGVRNSKMQTPVKDSIQFKVSTDGTTATVSWPLVPGANGHEVTFENVDDPANPVIVDDYDKKIIDGSKFTVSVAEDSKYRMTMRTLGNHDLGNTDDDEAKVYDFSTLVPSIATIPSGTDIYEWWTAQQLDTTRTEVAIELEAGGEYTISGQVDFGPHNLTFRGDKVNRPTVRMTGGGSFATYSGLKIKFINFDLTESTERSFLYVSPKDNLPDSILIQNLPNYVGSKVGKGYYMLEQPVYIAHCWFKNLQQSILHDNNVAVAMWYFTLSDCIVQINDEGKNGNVGFICFYEKDANNGGRSVKNINIENSTIYNIQDNASGCFIRYSNESNSQPDKTYGSFNAVYQSQSWRIANSTLSNVYYSKATNNGWRFCNNVRGNDMALSIERSIFYNCTQLYRMTGLGSRSFRFNFFWNDRQDDKNRNNSSKDSSGAPFASEYEPQFAGDIYQELDLTQPNGGVNFAPRENEILVNRGGDPRWLSEKQ